MEQCVHRIMKRTCALCRDKNNDDISKEDVKDLFDEINADQDQSESVCDQIQKKNKENSKGKQKRWSGEDDQFLRDNIDKMSNQEMANELGRTQAAVAFRLVKQKIKRKPKSKNLRRAMILPFTIWVNSVLKNRTCIDCRNLDPTSLKITVNFSNHLDLWDEIKEIAKKCLRTPENQILWMIKRIQDHGKLKEME